MNPNDTRNGDIPDWFADKSAPTEMPDTSSTRRKISMKYVLIVFASLSVVGFLLAGVMLALFLTATKCLSKSDYEQLFSTSYTDESSFTENFYTESVAFDPNTTKPSADSDEVLKLIKKLGELKTRQANTSMVITLTSTYTSTETSELATERTDAIKKIFVAAGINEEMISVQAPRLSEPESDLEALTESGRVTFTIRSDDSCRAT